MLLSKYRFQVLAGGAIFLLVFYFLFTYFRSYFPPCIFYALTGMHCPGCGLTRALFALLNLDLLRAVRMNALFTLLGFPLLGLVVVQAFCNNLIFSPRVYKHLAFSYLTLAALFTVARNIPFAPFTLLAPY